jgi:hypothetical protein
MTAPNTNPTRTPAPAHPLSGDLLLSVNWTAVAATVKTSLSRKPYWALANATSVVGVLTRAIGADLQSLAQPPAAALVRACARACVCTRWLFPPSPRASCFVVRCSPLWA